MAHTKHSSNPRAAGRFRRHNRVRKHISGSAARPRLAVFRSAKHVVAHPFDVLAAADRWALAGAIALFVGGLAGLQWQTVRNLSRERTTTVLLVAALCALAGPHVDGVVLVALVGLVVAPQQAHTYRSFVRASMAS